MIVTALSLYLTYAGAASYALAIEKHHLQAFQCSADRRRKRWLRFSGGALLVAALCLWVWAFGEAMGLVSWILWVLPVASILVAAGLAFKPSLTAQAACRIAPN